MKHKLVIIIPTYDNTQMLHRTIASICEYTRHDVDNPYFHILIVNNGQPELVSRTFTADKHFTVLDTGKNLGWEGGLVTGLNWMKATGNETEYVMFANDDIQVPPNDPLWLEKMMATLEKHPDCGAVGPTSNFVMGPANFQAFLPAKAIEVSYLVGFCVLLRRKALEDAGGVAVGLPGGDDIDLSLRMRAKGYKMAVRGDAYVHHYGSATGSRLHGRYWNSPEMTLTTRTEMIRRNGLKAYIAMMRWQPREL